MLAEMEIPPEAEMLVGKHMGVAVLISRELYQDG